ncbi:hypothetical protein JTB14_011957 [Gonioctena quinquepunctata]|nr:hypothetical protein JTB14_011957 [Gonioctena quinquepunctata]
MSFKNKTLYRRIQRANYKIEVFFEDQIGLDLRIMLHAQQLSMSPLLWKKLCRAIRWRSAMDEEMESLKNKKAWILMPLPPNRKAIKCKWVYKMKRKPDA